MARNAPSNSDERDDDPALEDTDDLEEAVPKSKRQNIRSVEFANYKTMQKIFGEVYAEVMDGFSDKQQQITNCERYWQVYNCELTTNQAYQGNTQIYLPIVHDAIEARVTRFKNMLFPDTEQFVDVTSMSGDWPHAVIAMINHYVKRAQVRTIAPALLRNGEVEGHYSIYVDWQKSERHVTRKVKRLVDIDQGVSDPDNEVMDVEDETIKDQYPAIEVLNVPDIVVLPATADAIEVDADTIGIMRRYSRTAIKAKMRDGTFDKEAGKKLLRMVSNYDASTLQNTDKKKAISAGVRVEAGYKVAQVYEVWKRLSVRGENRWMRIFFGDESLVLSARVNPNWNDRCSLISIPRTKVAGSFWGKSPVDAVEQLQYCANDSANMGMDSAQYSLLPIVMTDPLKNPNYASMILNLAAVWQTSPNDTQFAEFPQLWKDAFEIIGQCKSQIMQSFGLNSAMMPQGAMPRKPTQAEVAQEQQVAMASTADEVSSLEDGLFTPLSERFFELDQQHRDEPMVIKLYGQLGIAAKMEEVPPFAWSDRYEFRWRGVQIFRSAQQTQQMIAGMNVLRSLPPVLPNGMRIDITPIIETLVENTYGPRMGARILIDGRDQLGLSPELENQMMHGGVDVPVHLMDDDVQHLQAHAAYAQRTKDPNGLIRAHAARHLTQMQKKQQQQMPQGLPGAPGSPGAAGTPRPGAIPAPPRGGQQPPGMIASDQLQDPARMPRKAG